MTCGSIMWSEGTTERMVTATGFLKGCDVRHVRRRIASSRPSTAMRTLATGRAFPFTIKVGTVAETDALMNQAAYDELVKNA